MLRKAISQLFSGPPKPSCDTTASIDQVPLDNIAKHILAFRTITKLLSLIQQEQAVQVVENIPEDGRRRRELQILNALSTVAVIEHEVVAVVNNLDSKMLDPNFDTLSLIAVVKPSNDENQHITPPKLPFWRVILTQNYRRDTKLVSPSTEQATIAGVEVLADLNLADDQAIKEYADQCW